MGWLGKILVIPILFIGLLITVKSLDYYSPDFSSGFLSDKEDIFKGLYKIAFYFHIISTPIALLIGTIQVFFNLNNRFKKSHQLLGKIYVFLILIICAPSGLIMSFYSFGGILSIISFLLLSVLLFYYTFKSYRAILNGDVKKHTENIIRSYLLLISAILLRILSFVFIHYFNWEGETMYTTIAWLSWLPSLIIYQLYLIVRH